MVAIARSAARLLPRRVSRRAVTRRGFVAGLAGSVVLRREAQAYAYRQFWQPGNIVVRDYTVPTMSAQVPQGLQEWSDASGGLLTFTHQALGYRSDCDTLVPGNREFVLCSCEHGIALDNQGFARCTSSPPPTIEHAGFADSFVDESGRVLTGARILFLAPEGEAPWYADSLICHELGHGVGLDHPPAGTDSCVEVGTFKRKDPSTEDARVLQEALARTPQGNGRGGGEAPGKKCKGKKGKNKRRCKKK
jgi:hypothetical protein